MFIQTKIQKKSQSQTSSPSQSPCTSAKNYPSSFFSFDLPQSSIYFSQRNIFMKKFDRKLIALQTLGVSFIAGISPTFAAAATPFTLVNPIQGVTDLRDLINNLLNYMMGFIGIIAVVFMLYSGFKYVTAGGDSKKAGEAKEGITHAVIGIAIAVIGYLLVSLVFTMLGVNKQITQNAGFAQ
jgi:hypothetical protein